MVRFAATTVFLIAALVSVSAANAAATPIQRLTYAKAVAYWTAQAKAHKMPISCTPWTAKWVSSDYECVFGTVNRISIDAQPKCELVIAVYEKTHSVRGGNDLTGGVASVRVPLCKAGWQANLPTPWNLPPSS